MRRSGGPVVGLAASLALPARMALAVFLLLGLPVACGNSEATDGDAPAALGAVAAQGASSRPAARGAGAEAVPQPAAETPALRRLRARVVATYPHDPTAFTQGLLLHGDDLLESTGRYGVSELRRVEIESGRVIRRTALPEDWFGEGLALLPAGAPGAGGEAIREDRLVQLTWRERVAAVWDAVSFRRLGQHRYAGEGWGLCYDAAGRRLVMSDGSDWLSFRDPATFAEADGVAVRLEGRPQAGLNELECVDGRVWANVYGSEALVEVDLADGRVTALVDASGMLAPEDRPGVDVLNGIARDPADGTLLLTGKLWPKLFRVELVDAAS